MVLVVILGYLFTVRPIVQHQLLQEKAAQLERDIRSKEERLNSVTDLLQATEGQVRLMQEQLSAEQAESDRLAETVRKLEEHEQSLTFQISESEGEVRDTVAKYERALWQLFVNDFQLYALPSWEPAIWAESYMSWDSSGMRIDSTPHPYQNLLDAVETMGVFYRAPNDYPDEYFELAQAHIESRRDLLICEPPDASKLNEEYRAEIQRMAGEIEYEVLEYVARRTRKAAAEGHEIVSAEEDIESYRTSIRYDMQDEIRSRFGVRADSLFQPCYDKRNLVLSELIGLKTP